MLSLKYALKAYDNDGYDDVLCPANVALGKIFAPSSIISFSQDNVDIDKNLLPV